jgi:hypothetical protein
MQSLREPPLSVLAPQERPNGGHDILQTEAVVSSGRAMQKGFNAAQVESP